MSTIILYKLKNIIGIILAIIVLVLLSRYHFYKNNRNSPASIEIVESGKRKEVLQNYPLEAHLPYQTKDYIVSYMQPRKLIIKIYNPSLNDEIAILQVKDWVKSNGLEPFSHEYITLRPVKSN